MKNSEKTKQCRQKIININAWMLLSKFFITDRLVNNFIKTTSKTVYDNSSDNHEEILFRGKKKPWD